MHIRGIIATAGDLVMYGTQLVAVQQANIRITFWLQVKMPRSSGDAPVQVRIGIHTGDVVSGLIGAYGWPAARCFSSADVAWSI
eukprot:686593-Pelagomonas_calceolata.AAC.5